MLNDKNSWNLKSTNGKNSKIKNIALKKPTIMQKSLLSFSCKILYEKEINNLKIRYFPEKASNVEETKKIRRKLSGHDLSKIIVGETIIDFGKIFINSKAYTIFPIRNNLRTPIQAKLLIGSLF